ncbi:MAG: hypothetical protein AB7K68_13185 [Bacteriovoracia bacterium]
MQYLLSFLLLVGCTSNEKTLLFECNEQNQGDACFKLGNAHTGEGALAFYRRGCEIENVNSCGALLTQAPDREKAQAALKSFCDRGNANACGKLKDAVVESFPKK